LVCPALGASVVCLCAGTPKRTYGASAPASVLGTPLHTRGAWTALDVTHARAPLGDT